MRLTKKKAIQIQIELFEHLEKTGGDFHDKGEWMSEHYEEVEDACALCDYNDKHTRKREESCGNCPYYTVFGYCCSYDAPFFKWYGSRNPGDRKKYTREILEQLRQL